MDTQTLDAKSRTPKIVDEKLAKTLSHPIRVKVIDTLSKRVMSVSGFVRIFPQYTHSQVYGQFRRLERDEFIELVETRTGGRRRGATERFYRATARSLFDETSWHRVPDALKTKVTAAVFSTYIDRVSEAVNAGTIDKREDRHFTWSDPCFDEQAWEETIGDLEALFERIPIREAEAAERMAESGEGPFPVTVALACFESPDVPTEDD